MGNERREDSSDAEALRLALSELYNAAKTLDYAVQHNVDTQAAFRKRKHYVVNQSDMDRFRNVLDQLHVKFRDI